MSLKITRNETDQTIIVQGPYNSELPDAAKQLGGRWDVTARAWRYDLRAEPQVRDLYLRIYGEWDDVPTEMVTVRCVAAANAYADLSSLQLGGRMVAHARGRDTGAIIGLGIIVESGKFDSGGSRKNWTTFAEKGTRFRIHDMPRRMAEKLVEDPDWCESVEIVEANSVDADALRAERERLVTRIAEIDKLLENK